MSPVSGFAISMISGQGICKAPAELGAVGRERHCRGDAHGLLEWSLLKPLQEPSRKGGPEKGHPVHLLESMELILISYTSSYCNYTNELLI